MNTSPVSAPGRSASPAWRRALPRLALALCAAALVACADAPDAAPPSDTAAPARAPQRVVPASSGVLDLVVELLPPERVAGLPEQALVYSAPLPAGHPLLERPRFEKYDGESILALDPDLVIAQVWQSRDTGARIREGGVDVRLLERADDWATLRARITQLGAWLHAPERAAALVAETDARVEALLALPASGLRALAYSNYGGHGRIAGADTTSHEILRLAGLRDLAAEAGLSGHPSFSFEQLLSADPDVLVVGRGDSGADGSTLQTLRTDARLSQLRAVREQRVLVLPSWLNTTTSHHMLTAAEELRAQLAALPDAPASASDASAAPAGAELAPGAQPAAPSDPPR